MKNGILFIESFNPSEINGVPGYEIEGMEEVHVLASLVNMKLRSSFKNSDYILIEAKDVEGVPGIGVRITRDNKNFNPNGDRNDPKNKKFFTVSKLELKTNGSALVKAQQTIRDGRLIRISFDPR
jgi:hypothetical protein